LQPVDFTTLTGACNEIQERWLPARIEQVYQRDRYTIGVTHAQSAGWLDISWHPQAARLCIGDPPPRTPDTFYLQPTTTAPAVVWHWWLAIQ